MGDLWIGGFFRDLVLVVDIKKTAAAQKMIYYVFVTEDGISNKYWMDDEEFMSIFSFVSSGESK